MKKGIFKAIVIWSVLIWGLALARSEQKPLIEVKAQVDTATITIGDHITYSIIIDRRKDVRIIQPGPGINLGMFEIKSYNFHKPVQKGDRIIERYDYVISVYDTGRYQIPAYPLAYFLSDTASKPHIIEAPAITIYVKSLLKGEKKHTLKDIKPPLSVPFNYRFWIRMAVLVLLVAALLYLLYLLWKRKRERGYVFTPPPPPPPAHEVALRALRKLYESDLLDKQQYKEFFSQLSEIIRAYLEGRYYMKALEQTTGEILKDLPQEVRQDKTLYDMLKDILTVSDLIKFAKYVPAQEETERIKREAVDFVQQTKIVFIPEETETQEVSEALKAADSLSKKSQTENEKV